MNGNAQTPAEMAPVNDPNELAAVEGGMFLRALFGAIRDGAAYLSRLFGSLGL